MHILLIDDSADYRQLFIRRARKNLPDISIDEYDPRANGIPAPDFSWNRYELILLDYDLGLERENGLDWLDRMRRYRGMPPIVMLTGEDHARIAVEALKRGAKDYLLKEDIAGENLVIRLMDALAEEELEMPPAPMEQSIPTLPNFQIHDVDAPTPAIAGAFPATPATNILDLEIPGYRLLCEIGRGGMATAVLAERLDDELRVVLKIMFTHGLDDPSALRRFMREYDLLSDINHQHIVRIYERAFAADFAYIAMEYFPAGDLARRIRQGIESQQALEYLRQMALGLSVVHARNIVHRDIKPGNFLFKDDNTLTLTDFGVARLTTDVIEDITVSRVVVGTPYYISPEQAAGIKVDARSDLYSLGVIFYQMLTGERPYQGNSIAELLRAHAAEPIPRLPPDLARYQQLLDGLLAKEPGDRFQSANELLIGIDWVRRAR